LDKKICGIDTIELFCAYMEIFGTPHAGQEKEGDERLIGKTLGLVNGATWISLWTNYFGKRILPGVKLINVSNDAVQINFIKAYEENKECPPQVNKKLFAEYATQVHKLIGVDAIMITCSTMNRSYPLVQRAMDHYNVPVIQIDMPMMEQAVLQGEKILVIATHGPTIESTKLLLTETAEKMGKKVSFTEANVLEAFEHISQGKVKEHNEAIAKAIRQAQKKEQIDVVVLAQLSMAAFKLTYNDCEKEFGVPVLTSAECGFNRAKELLLGKIKK
jgi:Asp/Glu/hydantoin racemase